MTLIVSIIKCFHNIFFDESRKKDNSLARPDVKIHERKNHISNS